MMLSGGIRGILELTILQKVVDEVGFDLPIQELFDLAIGTSTGGLTRSFRTSCPWSDATSQVVS